MQAQHNFISNLEYSYSKYCNLIGQLQGTQKNFDSVHMLRRNSLAAYLLCNTVDYYEIIHVLHNYVVTRSFMNRPLFVYQSESELAC